MRKLLVLLLLSLALVAAPLDAARKFNGSSDFLEVSVAVVTNEPFTIACWFNAPNVTKDSALITINDSSVGTLGWGLEARGDVVGDPIRARKGSTDIAVTSTGFSADTWHHAAATFTSDTARAAFIDGGSKGTNTNNEADLTPDRTSIGAWRDDTPSNFTDAKIAEPAIWDVVLTDDEIASLATGVSPLLVRPQNLVWYPPLIGRTSPEIELIQANNMTVTGATVATHAPIIYPTQPMSGFAAAAAPPARDLMIISRAMRYAPLPLLAGGMGLAWVVNRRNKLMRENKEELK